MVFVAGSKIAPPDTSKVAAPLWTSSRWRAGSPAASQNSRVTVRVPSVSTLRAWRTDPAGGSSHRSVPAWGSSVVVVGWWAARRRRRARAARMRNAAGVMPSASAASVLERSNQAVSTTASRSSGDSSSSAARRAPSSIRSAGSGPGERG